MMSAEECTTEFIKTEIEEDIDSYQNFSIDGLQNIKSEVKDESPEPQERENSNELSDPLDPSTGTSAMEYEPSGNGFTCESEMGNNSQVDKNKQQNSTTGKKKRADDYRKFKREWTELYLFVEKSGYPFCLICNDKLSANRKTSLERHFLSKHAAFALKYPEGEERREVCMEMLQELNSGSETSAGFAGVFNIIRVGKPFTDADYIKRFMIEIGDELFDEFPNKEKIMQKIKDLPLSESTVNDKALKMTEHIEKEQTKQMTMTSYFSLALIEMTDVYEETYLCIMTRYIHKNTAFEELLSLIPMKKETKGEDIFKIVMKFANEKKIQIENLISVCTDGTSSVRSKYEDFLTLLSVKLKRPILTYHSIAHQKALLTQSSVEELEEVMNLVVQVLDFILTHGLHHHPFQSLLEEINSQYPNAAMRCNTLLRGKVLAFFADCIDEIKEFLISKGIHHPHLYDCNWLLKFYYVVDMTNHLNELNEKLGGKGKTVLTLQQIMFAFESKLKLFVKDIEMGRLLHFQYLRTFCDTYLKENPNNVLDLLKIVNFVSELVETFHSHFIDFHKHNPIFLFMTRPYQVSLEDLDLSVIPGISVPDLHRETLSFKESSTLVKKFKKLNSDLEKLAHRAAQMASQNSEKTTIEEQMASQECEKYPNEEESEDTLILQTWHQIPAKYTMMHRLSLGLLSVFGSRYSWDKALAHLLRTEINSPMRLTPESLNACMKVKLTNCNINFKEF